MDMETTIEDLTREMNALEMEIRTRGGFALAAYAGNEERNPADPRIAGTSVGYFGIWE